nr:Chain A, Kalata [synthetic construct]
CGETCVGGTCNTPGCTCSWPVCGHFRWGV